MKKVILMFLFALIATTGFSQGNDVQIFREKDQMSDKIYTYTDRRIVLANDERTKGFSVDAYVQNGLSDLTIVIKMVGLGSCNENDEIIILFENGEKMIKKSIGEFNCKGQALFLLNDKEKQLLRSQPISKIRITNGRTYDSFTGDVKVEDKRYFIQLFYSLDNNLVKNKS